jgi:hypothetical protein
MKKKDITINSEDLKKINLKILNISILISELNNFNSLLKLIETRSQKKI